MFLTLALLYFALEYRISEKANLRMIIKSIIVALGLLLLRGGLSAILIVLCLSVAFWNVDLQGRKRIILRYVMILLVAGTSVFLLSMSMGDILLKVQYYITDRDVSEVGSIGLVTINRVSDLYKIPFTFLFAIVMPLGKITDISSWAGIVGSLNVVMAPIAIGAAIDIFLHKREELVLVGTCLVYYLLSIVSSIGIFRHYYSLLFIPIMLYSHMRHQSGNNIRHLWRIGSALYGFLLIIYVLI